MQTAIEPRLLAALSPPKAFLGIFVFGVAMLSTAQAVCVSVDDNWPKPGQDGYSASSYIEVVANRQRGEVRPGKPYCTVAHNSGAPVAVTIEVFDSRSQKSLNRCEIDVKQDLHTNLIVSIGNEGIWGVVGRKHTGNGV